MNGKTALVTGASSGIGFVIAERLAQAGFRTYGGARRVERMEPLKAKGIGVLPLDVTDAASIDAAVATIEGETGGVDVLVNNAGYGSFGAVEDVPIEEARRQIEVNLLGLAAVSQRVLPAMRAKRAGRIINISSIAGELTMPLAGWYHASKFGLEGLTAAMRQELAPFGVDVVAVRPGPIRSEWSKIAADSLTTRSGATAYAPLVKAMTSSWTGENFEKRSASPDCIADAVEKAATAKRPRTSYTAPLSARLMVLFAALAGTDRARDRFVARHMLHLPEKL
jgi:NAD(P)-dependent dehydrogenase (short-subunit alcohol dehydrogenase family)